MNINRQHTLNQLTSTIDAFINSLEQLEPIQLQQYSHEDTLIIMIDMINGFCKFGPLHSPFVNQMVPDVASFIDAAIEKGIPIISYRDAHPDDAKEFRDYPPHCLSGTDESKIVKELYRPQIIDVEKNSTNGFLAKNPLELVQGPSIKHIFVIGCVTDICVRDFASTLNKYLQEINQTCEVIIVENLVETFHIPDIHDREVEHVLALYQLKNSGIRLVRY